VLTIHLHAITDHIQLVIEDNGVGFDTKQVRRGIGLSNIYERTRFYNGKLKIKTAPGQGCKMIIDIPSIG
jgi:signal transduction histidine kinase